MNDCLAAILQDIIDIHASGGIVKMIFGRKKLTIWIHLIIGNIEGNNNLVGAYQNSGFWPYWACKCSWDDLDCKFCAVL